MNIATGDVLVADSPGGAVYVQYVGTHPDYGDAVRIEPRVRQSPPSALDDLFHDGYFTFYPARLAVKKGLMQIVGRAAAPRMPTIWRRAGVRRGTVIDTWVIEEETGEQVTRELTPAQRLLPIAAVWNHAMLLERVAAGWHPAQVTG
jgi:hypothetical protein